MTKQGSKIKFSAPAREKFPEEGERKFISYLKFFANRN